MDSILQSIEDWFRELLVSGIMAKKKEAYREYRKAKQACAFVGQMHCLPICENLVEVRYLGQEMWIMECGVWEGLTGYAITFYNCNRNRPI